MSPPIAFACAESVLLSSPESTPELFQQPTFAAPVLAARTAGGLKSLADRARERRKSGGVKQQQHAGGGNTLAVVVEEEGRGAQDNTSSEYSDSLHILLPPFFEFHESRWDTRSTFFSPLYTSNIELTPWSLPSSLPFPPAFKPSSSRVSRAHRRTSLPALQLPPSSLSSRSSFARGQPPLPMSASFPPSPPESPSVYNWTLPVRPLPSFSSSAGDPSLHLSLNIH